jgi:hypothetical protein
MDKEAELKEFFEFLTGGAHDIKKADLIFELENYAFKISEEVLKKIQEDVERHKSQTINYEDFKNMWKKNVEKTSVLSERETAVQLFNILLDIVYTESSQIKDKISADDIKKILSVLEISNNEPRNPNHRSETKRNLLAENMIKSIDLDQDNFVSLSDFEFLLKYYNENKDNSANLTPSNITKKY